MWPSTHGFNPSQSLARVPLLLQLLVAAIFHLGLARNQLLSPGRRLILSGSFRLLIASIWFLTWCLLFLALLRADLLWLICFDRFNLKWTSTFFYDIRFFLTFLQLLCWSLGLIVILVFSDHGRGVLWGLWLYEPWVTILLFVFFFLLLYLRLRLGLRVDLSILSRLRLYLFLLILVWSTTPFRHLVFTHLVSLLFSLFGWVGLALEDECLVGTRRLIIVRLLVSLGLRSVGTLTPGTIVRSDHIPDVG